jgi:hypothetical protein
LHATVVAREVPTGAWGLLHHPLPREPSTPGGAVWRTLRRTGRDPVMWMLAALVHEADRDDGRDDAPPRAR